MRVRLSRGSTSALASATTRLAIAPTVRHATRISCCTADFEQCVASHAAMSSKARVWPAPWRAQGTEATTTPWSGQVTLGASASSQTCTVPRSSARHRRRPCPWS